MNATSSQDPARGCPELADAVGRDGAMKDHSRLRINGLEALFAPRSVAVIGATDAASSVGKAIMDNLACFQGEVFPINPKRSTVCGQKALPHIFDLPQVPDMAIVATPAATVPAIIGACADAGVRSAVVISAGFKETGPSGRSLEREMLRQARKTGMRILGPNCLGLMLPHRALNATFSAGMAKPGSVAFLSQSGALCTAILDWSRREGVGFSAFASLGSMLDVGWGDLIEVLGDDPSTKSIVCYMESIGDARGFLSAAREVSFTKPIVVIKVGRTEAAAKAAASHTGSMTGHDAVLDAAFQRSGVLRVDTIEELFDMAEVLAKQPRPSGPRLAMVTNAGGPAALATDRLILSGAQLAELRPESIAALDRILPAAWSHGNPVDVLGAADALLYSQAIEIALADVNVDGVLAILTPQSMTDAVGTASRFVALSKTTRKPLLASWMGGEEVEAGRKILNGASLPTYDYPDAAARTFALMWQYGDRQRLLYERPELPNARPIEVGTKTAAVSLVDEARCARRTILAEVESKQLLAAYGIPTTRTLIASTEDEAVRIAAEMGFPVVLKLFSETITHKSDVGGVYLDLRGETAVRRAWNAIRHAVSASAGKQHFLGASVQPMVKSGGVELILGSSVDPQFGPVILFGHGGSLVECMKDWALGLPPLTTTLAHRLIEQTRIHSALMAMRGGGALDIPALIEVVMAFSHLVAEQRWIKEIEINPLLVGPAQMVALDARVVLHASETAEEELPGLAIRPYPVQYTSHIRLGDRTRFLLRPIRPEDEEMLEKFHASLSPRSVHFRYFGSLSLETRTEHRRLSRVCFADYDREIAIVAEHGSESARSIAAVARLNRVHRRNEAEFAVLVGDRWQNRGLGTRLMEKLVQIGRSEKLNAIIGVVLCENIAMLRICRSLGFVQDSTGEAGTVTVRLNL